MNKYLRVALVLALHAVAVSAVAQSTTANKLVGSWTWRITIPDRPVGPIVGLANVQADGTMISADATQVIPQLSGPPPADPFYTTASLGAWKATKDGYSATHTELLVLPDSSLFASCVSQWAVKVSDDGNSFDGTASFRCTFADGSSEEPVRLPISGVRQVVKDE